MIPSQEESQESEDPTRGVSHAISTRFIFSLHPELRGKRGDRYRLFFDRRLEKSLHLPLSDRNDEFSQIPSQGLRLGLGGEDDYDDHTPRVQREHREKGRDRR